MSQDTWKELSKLMTEDDPPLPKKKKGYPNYDPTSILNTQNTSNFTKCTPILASTPNRRALIKEQKTPHLEAQTEASEIPQAVYNEKHYYWNPKNKTAMLGFCKDFPVYKTSKGQIQPNYWKHNLLVDENFNPVSTQLTPFQVSYRKTEGRIFTLTSLQQRQKIGKSFTPNEKRLLEERLNRKRIRLERIDELNKDIKSAYNKPTNNLLIPSSLNDNQQTANLDSPSDMQTLVIDHTIPPNSYVQPKQCQTNPHIYYQDFTPASPTHSYNWESLPCEQLIAQNGYFYSTNIFYYQPYAPVYHFANATSYNQQAVNSFLSGNLGALQSQHTANFQPRNQQVTYPVQNRQQLTQTQYASFSSSYEINEKDCNDLTPQQLAEDPEIQAFLGLGT